MFRQILVMTPATGRSEPLTARGLLETRVPVNKRHVPLVIVPPTGTHPIVGFWELVRDTRSRDDDDVVGVTMPNVMTRDSCVEQRSNGRVRARARDIEITYFWFRSFPDEVYAVNMASGDMVLRMYWPAFTEFAQTLHRTR
jgi:hypothetical protein